MWKIENRLIVGVAVDRGHRSLENAEFAVQHLGHRRQAVGGAGRVGDDVVLCRIVHVVVHAQHKRDVLIGGRGGDDYFFYRPTQMFAGLVRVCEMPRGFHHDLSPNGCPVQLRGIFDGKNLQPLTANGDGVRFGLDLFRQTAQNRIVFHQMGQGLRVGQIIDRHELDILPMKARPDYVPADAAKAVDGNFYRHCGSSLLLVGVRVNA